MIRHLDVDLQNFVASPIFHYILTEDYTFSIHIENIGKRFYQRWLFRNISLELVTKDKLALIGTNGSGKSTLMRMVAGQLSATEGKLYFSAKKRRIPTAEMYQHVSWAGPQLQLYTDFTLREHLQLHFQFKQCLLPSIESLLEILRLEADADKKLRFFSSGMLQRVKVGLALFSASDILLLDEPTSNLDERNSQYLLALITEYIGNRIYILASNLEREYADMKTLVLEKA